MTIKDILSKIPYTADLYDAIRRIVSQLEQ